MNMAIYTRFISNFTLYSGAIWQILMTSITAGLYSKNLLHN